MKLAVAILLSCMFVFICSNKGIAQKDSLLNYQSVFNHELKDWTKSFENFDLHSFTKVTVKEFGAPESIDMKTDSWKNFLSIYKPLLSYSKNQKHIIDIYSYNLALEKRNDSIFANDEGESQVVLYNLEAETTTPLFFLGYSSVPQEAIWLSDDIFLIVANTMMDDKKVSPIIYIGDDGQKKLYIYSSSDPACCKEVQQYFSPKFNDIKIYN